jgi:hypothetical protein
VTDVSGVQRRFFSREGDDEGNVSKKGHARKDFAWLDRTEVVARVLEELASIEVLPLYVTVD